MRTGTFPNVAVSRQDGIDYLVMEYLEGETLATRLGKDALPVDQALRHVSFVSSEVRAAD